MPAGKLVVVIDDEAMVLEAMGGLLRSWGCGIVSADTADAALAALAEHGQRPDLVISDYRLSNGTTGIEAIEQLRRAFREPIPAFLLSGDTGPERLRDARASGLPSAAQAGASDGAARDAQSVLEDARRCGCGDVIASVPIPKFASFCGTLVCELRN